MKEKQTVSALSPLSLFEQRENRGT